MTAHSWKKFPFNTPFFLVEYLIQAQHSVIKMSLPKRFINTGWYPQTLEYTQQHFPQVLKSQCFNDLNLPFAEELKRTEMGHFFEHVLLAYMVQLKVEAGQTQVTYSARTSWNWKLNPIGSFVIRLEVEKADQEVLLKALKKASLFIHNLLAHLEYQRPDNSLVVTTTMERTFVSQRLVSQTSHLALMTGNTTTKTLLIWV